MKKLTLFLFLITTLAAQAQTDSVQNGKKVWPSFLTKEQLPDGTAYLPAPPAFGSELFVADMVRHNWGKSLRDTPRGEQARRESDLSLSAILKLFSAPFGRELSREQTPATASLIERILTDASSSTSKAKRHFNRQRPFLYFKDGTLMPEEEASHLTPCYPSSHAAMGWTVALVLTELNPERAEPILKTGYEYGQSRVIAGYHYQSDVEAARIAASACVARLHADDAFLKQLKKVRKELEKQ